MGRAPQGRDDGHLLRRDQPALRRRDAAAEPRRDRAAVGDRQHRRRRSTRAGSSTPASRSHGPRTASHDAKPASATGGQAWALDRIQGGDKTCKANQDLHPEAVDLLDKIRAKQLLRPEGRRPALAGQVRPQDPHAGLPRLPVDRRADGRPLPRLPPHFTGTDRKWFTFTNGAHIDSLDPATFNRWYDFLELYVAQRRPQLSPGHKALAPAIYGAAMGISGRPPAAATRSSSSRAMPPRWRRSRRSPPVRILFDNGAGGATPGAPFAGFERSFDALPGAGDAGAAPGTWPTAERSSRRNAGRGGAEAFTWDRDGPAADRLHRRHRRRARAACGPRPPRTTGRRAPRDARSPT